MSSETLDVQFRNAIRSAMSAGVKIEYPPNRTKSVVCACGTLFAEAHRRKVCSECEEKARPKGKKKLGRFTCPYCMREMEKTRRNQATCFDEICDRMHKKALERRTYVKV